MSIPTVPIELTFFSMLADIPRSDKGLIPFRGFSPIQDGGRLHEVATKKLYLLYNKLFVSMEPNQFSSESYECLRSMRNFQG